MATKKPKQAPKSESKPTKDEIIRKGETVGGFVEVAIDTP